MRRRVAWLNAALSLCLLALGVLRLAAVRPGACAPFAGLTTTGYIVAVVAFTILLMRAGLPVNRLGFGVRLGRRRIVLAFGAVAILQIVSFTLEPIWEALLSGPRNLERFPDVQGSPGLLPASSARRPAACSLVPSGILALYNGRALVRSLGACKRLAAMSRGNNWDQEGELCH